MTIEVEAIFQNGVLQPTTPIPLQDHQKVRLTIESTTSLARETAGMVNWSGDQATLDRLIQDPEFGIEEAP